MTDQQILEANIITVLNLQGLPDDRKLQLIQRVALLVQKAVQLRILKMLQGNDLEEFERLLAEKGEDSPDALDFIQKKIPNLAALYEQELVAVKGNLITNAGDVSI